MLQTFPLILFDLFYHTCCIY